MDQDQMDQDRPDEDRPDEDRPATGVLYHIATAADWAQAQRDGEYRMSTRGRTLAAEGYIHASTASQVLPVANLVYQDEQRDLLLLVLDPARIGAEIRWERVPGSAAPFPHIYGPLPVGAVRRAVPFGRDESGQFRFPIVISNDLGAADPGAADDLPGAGRAPRPVW